MLVIVSMAPVAYKNQMEGTMGNYDGNKTNDFIKKGATTPMPDNSKEKDLFTFGSSCKLVHHKHTATYTDIV